MSRLVLLAVLLWVPRSGLAQLPSVPGYGVTEYAAVTDPQRMSFDRETGTLYTGRDNSGTVPGDFGGAVKIHRIAPGGAPVTEYGNAAITDPDTVFFDAVGTASEGAAGSVIVGRVNAGSGTMGQLTAVRPDQSVEEIDGPSSDYANPADFAVDGTGRVLMADAGSSGQVRIVTGSGSPAPLITIPGAMALWVAIDAQDRIFVSKSDGAVALYDAAGTLIDASYVSGLGAAGGAIAVGPGGGFGTSLYVVDRTPGTLLRVDGAGMKTTIGTGFVNVADLEFGPDGALYAADFDNDRILRLDAPFPADWDGSSGNLPDQACPAWTLVDSATPEDPVLAGGVLTLSTSADPENMDYIQTAPDVVIPDPLVIEFRMRFVSGSSSGSTRAPGFVGVTTSPDVGVLFFVGPDEIFFTADGDLVGPGMTIDTDSAAHTYRIVVEGAASGSPVRLFRDGVLTLTAATYTDAPNMGPVERVFWGEGSVGTFGTLEWEFFRHNAAVCTTTTTTSSSTTSSSSTTTSSTSSSTTSTSTSTSSTTTAPPPTTSTTLLPGGCGGIPDGPSFDSILCRVSALLVRVNAESALGTFRQPLARSLEKARAKAELARTLCADGNTKKTKRKLQQAGKGLSQFAQRLKKLTARKRLDEAVRQSYLSAGEAIVPDVQALRAQVQCAAS